MDGFIQRDVSTILQKALTPPAQNGLFTIFNMTPTQPTGNGVFQAGQNGMISPRRIKIIPFAHGNAGLQFSMRVFAWEQLYGSGNENSIVWVPLLLVELLCTICNQPGPAEGYPGSITSLLGPTDQACDTISVVQGNLGNLGFVTSTGPGTDLIAFAMLDLTGPKLIQFDFQQSDPVEMNAMWRFA